MTDYLNDLTFKASGDPDRLPRRYPYRGYWYTVAELAGRPECVPCEGTLYGRLSSGFSVEEAVNRPISEFHREINKKRKQ